MANGVEGGLFLHPATLVGLEYVSTGAVLAFTSSKSLLRIAFVPIVLLLVSLIVQHGLEYTTMLWTGCFGAGSMAVFLHYLDIAVLNPLDCNLDLRAGLNGVARQDDKTQSECPKSLLKRFAFGLRLMCNFTHMGLPTQVKGIPSFYPDDPSQLPSRKQLIIRRAISSLACALFIDAVQSWPGCYIDNDEFTPDRVALFSKPANLAPKRIALRTALSLIFGFGIFVGIHFLYDLGSCLSLIMKTGTVESWPPVFGPLSDAYSLRSLWGSFWHQTFRSSFSAMASFIVFRVLRIPKHTITARALVVFFAFATSGVLHHYCALGAGLAEEKDGGVRFFVMQALGIIFEDVFQSLWARLTSRSGRTWQPKPWERAFGYAWVVFFIAWVTPCWIYPFMAHRPVPEPFLPWSVCQYVWPYLQKEPLRLGKITA